MWAAIFSVCDSELSFHPPRHTGSVARNSDDRAISMLCCVRPSDLLISRKAAATHKAEEKCGSKNPSHNHESPIIQQELDGILQSISGAYKGNRF